MKIVSREESRQKLEENINKIVENIISDFNERKDPNFYAVNIKLYEKLNIRHIDLGISKLNELLKSYNYVAMYKKHPEFDYNYMCIEYKKKKYYDFFRYISK